MAHRAVGQWLRRRSARCPARDASARLLLWRARRLHPPPARGRGHLARPRARACRDRAAERGRHARHLRQDQGHGRSRRVLRRLRVRAIGGRPGGGPARPPAAPFAPAAGAAPGRLRRRAFRLPAPPRPLHPLRPEQGAGAEHGVAGGGGREARHPLAAAERPEPDPARPRALPAAGSGHDHQLDAAHRGRARLGQGGDRPAAGRPRPARAQAAHGLRRRGRGLGRPPHRLPGRGQAAQRQPWPRRQHPPDGRGAGQGGLRHCPRAQPRRAGRELPRGPGSSAAGGQRRADRRLQAHARPRRRRRRA